jgi:hypothetical protein
VSHTRTVLLLCLLACCSGDGTKPRPPTAGGTITFTNIGAFGWWGRRLESDPAVTPNDPRCDVQAEFVDLGPQGGQVFCCRGRHDTTTDVLSPFDEQMALIMRGPLAVRALAVYQPGAGAGVWSRVSLWDESQAVGIKFTGPGDASSFTGRVGDGCQWYAMLPTPFPCGPGSEPFCPASGPDLHYAGWAGSKLVVFDASMPPWDDAALEASRCSTGPNPADAPWIGFSASELMRDGSGKYFPCHCYDNANRPDGAGCGEINLFEAVPEAEGEHGNRNILSTGLRSFQFGSLGGHVCGVARCDVNTFPARADLMDACSQSPIVGGATLTAGAAGPCPVWRRPRDRRFFFVLLDQTSRSIQVGIVHPQAVPSAAAALLPALPTEISRATVDALLALRLPTRAAEVAQ